MNSFGDFFGGFSVHDQLRKLAEKKKKQAQALKRAQAKFSKNPYFLATYGKDLKKGDKAGALKFFIQPKPEFRRVKLTRKSVRWSGSDLQLEVFAYEIESQKRVPVNVWKTNSRGKNKDKGTKKLVTFKTLLNFFGSIKANAKTKKDAVIFVRLVNSDVANDIRD